MGFSRVPGGVGHGVWEGKKGKRGAYPKLKSEVGIS